MSVSIIIGGNATLLAEIYAPNERFGVTYDYDRINKPLKYFDISPFSSLGWYADGQTDYPNCSGPVRFSDNIITRVITVGNSEASVQADTIRDIVKHRPNWFASCNGNIYWQIGNRLGYDCYTYQPYKNSIRDYLIQNYVDNFNKLSEQIRSSVQNSKIGFGIISNGHYLTSSYDNIAFLTSSLKRYYTLYHQPMNIDFFNLELTITESSIDLMENLKRTVEEFRNMISHIELANNIYQSYRDSELWIRISFYNTSFSTIEIKTFMQQAIDWLTEKSSDDIIDFNTGLPSDDYRLVQRWSWHPLVDLSGDYRNNSLYFPDGGITQIGQAYSQLIPAHCPEPSSFILFAPIIFNFRQRKIRIRNKRLTC